LGDEIFVEISMEKQMAKPYSDSSIGNDNSVRGIDRFYGHNGGRQYGYEEDGRPFPPQQPQDKSMQHGKRYDNDTQGWLRGSIGRPDCYHETAEHYPSFDKSPPRDKMRR
jgi:hypothetical protein